MFQSFAIWSATELHMLVHVVGLAVCCFCSTHRILSTIHTAQHSCVGQLLSGSWSKPAVLPWEWWHPHSCGYHHQLVPVEGVIIVIIYFLYIILGCFTMILPNLVKIIIKTMLMQYYFDKICIYANKDNHVHLKYQHKLAHNYTVY